MVTEKTENPAIKGPASYFPSIEEKYGKPIDFWFEVLDQIKDQKHMEQVNHLKAQPDIGRGHANALVAYYRAKP